MLFLLFFPFFFFFNCLFIYGSFQTGTDRYVLEHLFPAVELDFYGCVGWHGWAFITKMSVQSITVFVCSYLRYHVNALILLKNVCVPRLGLPTTCPTRGPSAGNVQVHPRLKGKKRF